MSCEAERHNSTYAYSRFRCRCPEAVERAREYWRRRPKSTCHRFPNILGGVDPAAVERALGGDRHIKLTVAEMGVVVGELSSWGRSAAQIAIRLGVSPRTVQRYRRRLKESA